MDKHEVNRLLFCMKEHDELKAFRDDLNNASGTILLKEQTSKFILMTRFCSFKHEYQLTDIQMTKLWAFLDTEVKHLEHHLANADPEEKEIAEAIYSGEISKDALKF